MKKTIYSVALTLAAGIFASCDTSVPKATLKDASKADTLSYVIGIAQSQGLKDYLVARMDMDTTYMNQFVSGVLEGVNADAKKTAYYSGLQIGQQEANQVLPNISSDLLEGKSGELNSYQDAALYGNQIKVSYIKNGVCVEYTIGRADQRRLVPMVMEKYRWETILYEKIEDGIKIMGDGELTKKLTVEAKLFTASAAEKITAAGGKTEVK